MNSEIQKLHQTWLLSRSEALVETPTINFNEITNAIFSSGPFYYYIVDFFDMSLSNVSPKIFDLHGLHPQTVTFEDILHTIHPDDVSFVVKAEAMITNFFYERLTADKLLSYKMSYSFRSRLKDGSYALLNHQALLLSISDQGKTGKSLNIHTRIDHLSNINTYKVSLIGLNGEPSFMDLSPDQDLDSGIQMSKREIEIIRFLVEGLTSSEIAKKLFISELTVRKHRKNILDKTGAKNTAQLISNCIRQGLV